MQITIVVTNSSLSTEVLKLLNESSGSATEFSSRGLVKTSLNTHFHIPLTNMSSKPVYMLKNKIAGYVTYSTVHVAETKAALLGFNPRTAAAVHYKTSKDGHIYIKHHKEMDNKKSKMSKIGRGKSNCWKSMWNSARR